MVCVFASSSMYQCSHSMTAAIVSVMSEIQSFALITFEPLLRVTLHIRPSVPLLNSLHHVNIQMMDFSLSYSILNDY